MIDGIIDVIRRNAENCDKLQGFQICHGVAGGTGGGIGSALFSQIKDNYSSTTIQSFTVYPSPKITAIVNKPYNAILSMNHLIKDCDLTCCIDNDRLLSIVNNRLKIKSPTYSELNWVTSLAMANVTVPYRFLLDTPCESHENITMRRIGINLIPFPRLHFTVMSTTPFYNQGQGERIRMGTSETGVTLWEWRSMLANVGVDYRINGKYFSSCTIWRGNFGHYGASDMDAQCQQILADDIITWIPDNVVSLACHVPPVGTHSGASLIANNTGITNVFQRILDQFGKLYGRKEYLYNYLMETMEERDFDDAMMNVTNLINEYKQMEEATVDLYEEDDETDDEYTTTEDETDYEEADF